MTDHTPPPGPARSFGTVAAAYDRGRPEYPREAAAWLAGPRPLSVLEVGAGTGKLTRHLVALGHDVHATDPDEAMLAVLAASLPDVRVSQAPAEDLPVPDRSVDLVVGAQCFHWFDLERALPEIARVLKPGGSVAMTWAERDERIPWVRRLGRILSSPGERRDWTAELVTSERFGFVEEASYPFWQGIDRESLRDLVVSRSHVTTPDEEQGQARLEEALALYDGFGRGWEGMQLPYFARCYRARVVIPRAPDRPRASSGDDPAVPPGEGGPAGDDERVDPPTDDDSGTLLIDFR